MRLKGKKLVIVFFFSFSRSSYSPRKAGPSLSRRRVEPGSVRQLHTTQHLYPSSLTTAALPHSTSPVPHKDSASAPLAFGLPSTVGVGSVGTYAKPNLDLSGTSGQFLAETRATFARLEKEAEELEKTYQSFHQKTGVESPQLCEDDEPLLPLHHATLADHESSSTTTTPDQEVSPTITTSTEMLQPIVTLPTQSQSPPISSTTMTTTTYSTAQTVTSTSSVQPSSAKSLISTSHPPSSLTTVIATAPPTLTATTTPPLDVAAVPSPPLTSSIEAKPTKSVSQQQVSTKETSTKARQRLTLDDWWKKSPPSSVSSKQPPNTEVASSESSKPTTVDGGHNKSPRITEKPKMKLEDLWKSSNVVGETRHTADGENNKTTNSSVKNGQRSHSPPPMKVEKPKLSLDDLWKSPSLSKPQATSTVTSAEPAVAMSKRLREERDEKEKLRKEQQLQEQEKVRKELEKLERQEKLRKVEPSNQQSKAEPSTEQNLLSELDDMRQRTNSSVGQDASVEVSGKERQGGENEKKPDNDGIDPVMLKYMELVKEKREKQQVRELMAGI